MRRTSALIPILLLLALPAVAGQRPVVVERNGIPQIPAVRVNPAPVIDGVLDDHAWSVAPSVSDFWCIDLDKPPSEPTTMWLAYDEQHVYFAFYCKDSQPERIVAVETKRNGSIFRDDHVEIDLDPVHLHRGDDSYEFAVTARGTQSESIPGGSASKIEWRGDWRAAARIVADGYIVEMAIPLQMLRRPRGQTTFGLSAQRRHARTLERSTYPPMRGSFDRTRTADWVGLQLPDYRPPMRFMPFTVAEAGGADPGVRLGFDLKQSFSNGLTGVLTSRPDFRNIEGDVLSLDFSYNERLARETRPFFLEGAGYFPPSTLFATQRVRELDAGVKLFGSLGATQVGILGIYSGDTHRATAMALDHRVNDHFRLRGAFAGRADSVAESGAWQVGASYSRPSPRGTPYADLSFASLLSGRERTSWGGSIGFQPRNGRLGGWFGYRRVEAGFRPVDGFVPERDLSRFSAGVGIERRYARGPIDQWEIDLSGSRANRLDGSFFYRTLGLDLWVGLRNGTGFSLQPAAVDRVRRGNLFRDRTIEASFFWNRFKLYRQGSISFVVGEQAGGPLRQVRLRQGFRFGERFGISWSTELRDGFDGEERRVEQQTILSLNYDFTPERGVSGRLVQRDRHSNWYLAYRQNVRRGMDIYLILGDPNTPNFSSRLAVKFVQVY